MKVIKKIGICCDHAGFGMKEFLKTNLAGRNFEVQDYGAYSEESVDYPDFAHITALAVENNEVDTAIIICGTGNGISMAANKHKGIRAALCWIPEIAKLAREHNNANICALPARFISEEDAVDIVNIFLTTVFEGGRHERRVNKIPFC